VVGPPVPLPENVEPHTMAIAATPSPLAIAPPSKLSLAENIEVDTDSLGVQGTVIVDP